jgi:zinc protease
MNCATAKRGAWAHRVAVLFFGIVPALLWPGPTTAALFNAQTFTLDNGLQVVVLESHRAPVVTQMLWYKVGATDGPSGKVGLAHFLEHMMFRGTRTMGPGVFAGEVARLGGDHNAFTLLDSTYYVQSVAVEHLETVMRMEADRMVNLVITDDIVLPEVAVVVEERNLRVDNDPQAQLNEVLRATLYMNHPYGQPGIGWRHEIETLTTADAVGFYETWYAPNNAVLVIAGDVTVEQVRALAEKTYGPIPRREVPERVRLQEPPHHAARSVVMTSPLVQVPSWTRLYLAPSYSTDMETALGIDMFADILAGGPTSRLYRELVLRQGIAGSILSFASGYSFDEGVFMLFGSPRPGGDPRALEAGVDAVLEEALANGVTEEEVATAKVRVKTALVFASDSLQGPATIIGQALTTGNSLEDIEQVVERIDAITVEEVNAAARAVLRIERSATGLLLPEPAN